MSNEITALIIDPTQPERDGVATIIDDLATLRDLVGGDIEAVYGYRRPDRTVDGSPRITLYCNENGKIHGLPINRVATTMWWHYNPEATHQDVLVGPVVIVGGGDHNGDNTSLPDDVKDIYIAVLMSYVATEA